jgi:membrane protein required for colicin V production
VNWVDLIVIVVLGLFGLRGYFRGLFREVFSLAGLACGFMLAVVYGAAVAVLAAAYWSFSPLVLKGGAFITIFFVVYFSFSLVGWLVHRSVKLLFLQTVNRTGGIAIGMGKGAALIGLAIFFLSSAAWLPERARENIAGAYLIAPLTQLGERLVRVGKEKIFLDNGAMELPTSGTRL